METDYLPIVVLLLLGINVYISMVNVCARSLFKELCLSYHFCLYPYFVFAFVCLKEKEKKLPVLVIYECNCLPMYFVLFTAILYVTVCSHWSL